MNITDLYAEPLTERTSPGAIEPIGTERYSDLLVSIHVTEMVIAEYVPSVSLPVTFYPEAVDANGQWFDIYGEGNVGQTQGLGVGGFTLPAVVRGAVGAHSYGTSFPARWFRVRWEFPDPEGSEPVTAATFQISVQGYRGR